MSSKYLYCVVSADENTDLTELSKLSGLQGEPVHTISHDNLTVVVSDSPVVEYERTRRNMVAHTRVLETVMQQTTILPVRFGTVAPTTTDIQTKLLEMRQQEFNGLLESMQGRVELGLKVLWRDGAVFEEIIAENDDIRRLRDSLQNSDPAKTHFDRMRLGQLVEAAVEAKREAEEATILSRLEPLAEQVKRKKTFTEQMVVNAAFLVNQAQEAAFDEAIRQLDAEREDRAIFKYVGPVPPYNFVTIVLNWN